MVLLCMKAKGDLYQDNDKNKIKDFSKIISLSPHVPLNDLSHENSARNKDHTLVFFNRKFKFPKKFVIILAYQRTQQLQWKHPKIITK